ncbi:MAG: MFS transporter [Deltaproteobacteria bacterium]|nr:MFS transporter [Deltaproteobacteria bacterium]MBW2371975.1 MFS transporter [Deltaproteobacteria bacterium]
MADASPRRLTVATKVIYSLGDHTVNVFLTAMTMLYINFLTDVVHFPIALAGAIPLVGRFVDAITDPLMGRISDHTRWRWGRRRPYMLIGCVPFGVSFALLWINPPFAGQTADFIYYTSVYVLLSIFSTVVTVPYMALIPEMARNYDERTSLNTYRAAAGLLGVFVTLSMSALARSLGGDARGWFEAAMIVGVWLIVPWFAVHRVTWERPRAAYQTRRIGESLRLVARHRTYMHLCAIYIPGRIAIDLVSAMFIFYVAWVIGRREDFELTMAAFLTVVILSLPFWLYLSKRFDKRSVMIAGLLWWMFAQFILFFGDADWPRWSVFLVAGFAGVGYAVADIMPWAMLPDVIDEDELKTGERREGLYSGMFTFLRKIGGAVAIFLMGLALSAAGYDGEAPEQSAGAINAIRILMALVPIVFLGLTAWIARTYPLSREVHHAILTELARREEGAGI